MAKELTETEYRQIAEKPKRRFQTLAVAENAVTLRQPISTPCYWFERNDVAIEEATGKFWRNPNQATISLIVDGKVSVLFYLTGRRLDSCTFAYHLTPTELRKAVTAMQRGGLKELIRPAAEWALRAMPAERRPVLEEALRDVLRSANVPKNGSAKRRRARSTETNPRKVGEQ